MRKITSISISVVASMSLLLASSSVSNFAHATTSEQSSVSTDKVKKYNQNGLSIEVELLEGTNENWTKLKVTNYTDGTTEYLNRTSKDNKEVINIETFHVAEKGITTLETQTSEKHEVVSQNGDITVDGKSMVKESLSTSQQAPQKNSISQTASNGTTFYFISKIDGSVNTDVTTAAICIAVLSAAVGFAYAIVTDTGVGIFAAKIPYVWYTKYKYSDKAPYRPLYRNEAYFFSDQLRTLQVGYSMYVV